MENFEKDLIQKIHNSIFNQVQKAEFVDTGYNSNKIKLPQTLMEECYKNIDMENLKKKITQRLEDEVADKIVNKMLTEYANDVKQIMSNTELREELRGILRSKIKETKDMLCN